MKKKLVYTVVLILIFTLAVFAIVTKKNFCHEKLKRLSGFKENIYFAQDNLYRFDLSTKDWIVLHRDLNIISSEKIKILNDFLVYYNYDTERIELLNLLSDEKKFYKSTISCDFFSISNNGKYIGYTETDNSSKYFIVDINGDDDVVVVDLPQNIPWHRDNNITWSEDDRYILFSLADGIYLFSLENSTIKKIASGRNAQFVSKEEFVFRVKMGDKIEFFKQNITNNQAEKILELKSYLENSTFSKDLNYLIGTYDVFRIDNTVQRKVVIYDIANQDYIELPSIGKKTKMGVALLD